MSSVRLPEGGKAWFVRKGTAWCCSLTPSSVEGHLLTAFYALSIGGMIWLLLGRGFDLPRVIAFITIVLASTLLYVLTALRMSAPAAAAEKGGRKCS